jgi:FtsP/CotA-like multicopper oxidase with cupredoxin domain
MSADEGSVKGDGFIEASSKVMGSCGARQRSWLSSPSRVDKSRWVLNRRGGLMSLPPLLTRRELLAGALGAGALAGLSACGLAGRDTPVGRSAIAAAEAARHRSGTTRTFTFRATETRLDLGGTVVDTWAYGDSLPGRPVRVDAGDRVQIAFRNDLPEPTTVHWHGLAIRNDMDGVPGVTTPAVKPGDTFLFDFVVPDPGTYWFHPHHGLQLDRGLYAPFIVDDPADPGDYDLEWVLVLDDWTDGVGPSPEQVYATLVTGGGMPGMGHSMMTGMDAHGGDVDYRLYLINGKAPTDPDLLAARPGQRARLRIINAAADTIFNVAVADHAMTVTHADGYPVVPMSTSVLQIGMGERYDATISMAEGVFPLVAQPVGKAGLARALVRTAAGRVPPAEYLPRELSSDPLTAHVIRADVGAALPARDPDHTQDLVLSRSMRSYRWTINGRAYDRTVPLTIKQGQAGRLRIRNASMMPHPVHLHGHTFQLGEAGGLGARKDTVLVPAMGAVDVDFAADNPGRWMIHCHNAYHAEAGMMTRLDYLA